MELKRRKLGCTAQNGTEKRRKNSFLVCCFLPRCCSAPRAPRARSSQPQRPSLALDVTPPGHTSGSFLKSRRVSQKAKVCVFKKWAWGPTEDKEYGLCPQGTCCQGMEWYGPSGYYPKDIPFWVACFGPQGEDSYAWVPKAITSEVLNSACPSQGPIPGVCLCLRGLG